MHLWRDKLKESLYAVMPIAAIVFITALLFVPLSGEQIISFLMSAVCIIAGLTMFLAGVDRSVTPLGQRMGENLVRYNRIWIIVIAGLLLGFIISVAEPDLHILAGQVALVTADAIGKWSVVLVVSVGIAVLVSAGLVRILFSFPLYKLLTGLYVVIFVICLFISSGYLAISFDSSGATTGAMTVPFILALALGVSRLKKDSKASEKDSFGLVAIASVGAILSMLVMGLIRPQGEFLSTIEFAARSESIFAFILHVFLHQAQESLIAIAPILLLFAISQPIFLKLRKQLVLSMLKGFFFTYIGLLLILTGANAGFMEIGREIGMRLSRMDQKAALLGVGFVLGLVTVLAEPAVHVLTNQIEEVTSGFIRRSVVMIALSLGVGMAVAFSVLRILIPELQLWHILLPGYILAIILANIGPKLFVGIAFDSGGVASGPMTATFILAFAQGAANEVQSANVMVDGFGIIALVALTPIITLQVLGLIYQRKAQSKGGPKFV